MVNLTHRTSCSTMLATLLLPGWWGQSETPFAVLEDGPMLPQAQDELRLAPYESLLAPAGPVLHYGWIQDSGMGLYLQCCSVWSSVPRGQPGVGSSASKALLHHQPPSKRLHGARATI